jgi:hypothetical protein
MRPHGKEMPMSDTREQQPKPVETPKPAVNPNAMPPLTQEQVARMREINRSPDDIVKYGRDSGGTDCENLTSQD